MKEIYTDGGIEKMYCKHCGKEIADEAIMCPNCGTPTGTESKVHPSAQTGTSAPFGSIALFLACFALLTGIVFGAFFYVYTESAILLYFIGFTTILPALAAVCLGITTLSRETKPREYNMAVVAIMLAALTLTFVFLTACLVSSGAV